MNKGFGIVWLHLPRTGYLPSHNRLLRQGRAGPDMRTIKEGEIPARLIPIQQGKPSIGASQEIGRAQIAMNGGTGTGSDRRPSRPATPRCRLANRLKIDIPCTRLDQQNL